MPLKRREEKMRGRKHGRGREGERGVRWGGGGWGGWEGLEKTGEGERRCDRGREIWGNKRK